MTYGEVGALVMSHLNFLPFGWLYCDFDRGYVMKVIRTMEKLEFRGLT